MRKFFLTIALLISVVCTGNMAAKSKTNPKNVTTFMNIPIDGKKSAMIHKLQKKGFAYDGELDRLFGTFMGYDAVIAVLEDRGKVYQISVQLYDGIHNYRPDFFDEKSARFLYNKLRENFEESEKYVYIPIDSLTNKIPYDAVDITNYIATFYQWGEEREKAMVYFSQKSSDSIFEFAYLTVAKDYSVPYSRFNELYDYVKKRPVRYAICQKDNGLEKCYYFLICYCNELNVSDERDL